MSTVAIAGATGFIGSALLEPLAEMHQVVALTRGAPDSSKSSSSISWRQCDLFSLLETEQALEGVDFAVYLIHSMLPSAQLTQGEFENLDLLVADNFGRAAALKGIAQIVYVGGIVPQQEHLSRHLQSRWEVERALAAYGVPVTALRAALIIGAEGSSTQIITRLVRRLPFMVCPHWTEARSQPIALEDVIASICYTIGNKQTEDQQYDLAGPDRVSYREMMAITAEQLGLARKMISVPFISPRLSRLWVSLVTGAPRNLVFPLIESLRHSMVPDNSRKLEIPGYQFRSFKQSIAHALASPGEKLSTPRAFQLPAEERRRRSVRSVQRLTLPPNHTAQDVADIYINWLPKFLSPVLRVRVDGDRCSFYVPLLKPSFLTLERSEQRSTIERQLFYITDGLLARESQRARIEFRETYSKEHILVAVHDYQPSIPWFIYIHTQARLHLWIMSNFDRHLQSLAKGQDFTPVQN